MKQLDQQNYSLNPEQFVNLATSLSAFFEQAGVIQPPMGHMTCADLSVPGDNDFSQ